MDMKHWNEMCLDEQQTDQYQSVHQGLKCWLLSHMLMEINYCSLFLQYSFSMRDAAISIHTVWCAVVTNARQAFHTALNLKVCRSGYAEFHGPAGLAIQRGIKKANRTMIN